MNYVKVKFKNGNLFSSSAYTYKYDLDENIEIGDYVIVDTSNNGMTLAQVSEIDLFSDYNGELKEVKAVYSIAKENAIKEKKQKIKH